jgi:hypothetical protein
VLNSLRTGLGAVLATAVLISTPVLSSAAPTPPAAVLAPASATAQHYTRAEATAIFNRLEDALKPKRPAASEAGAPVPYTDVSMLIRDARLARGSMSARQQSIFDEYGRPVPEAVGCAHYLQSTTDPTNHDKPIVRDWVVSGSTHFCVHYQASGAAAATTDQVTTTLATLEYVYTAEVTTLGYHPPLADHDGLVDVFLDNVSAEGYYGFCTTDSNTARTSTAWCALDNDFKGFRSSPIDSLEVTAAHEFFHAIQFGYDVGTDDYLQYLPSSQIVEPRNSTTYAGDLERYGAVTFWKYLSERFKDVTIIRQIWESASVAAGNRNGIQAVVAVLKTRGFTFPPEFARYAVWNTLPPGTYADRRLFPKPTYWAQRTMTRRNPDTGVLSVNLNHLSTAPLKLWPGSHLLRRSKLKLIIDAPDLSHGSQVRVQLRYKSGKVVTYTFGLGPAGNGAKVYAFDPKLIRSMIVTMSNASTSGYNNQKFKVQARIVS